MSSSIHNIYVNRSQECVFEDFSLKRQVFEEVEKYVSDDVIMASSTGGIFPSRLSEGLRLQHRLVVAHPVRYK